MKILKAHAWWWWVTVVFIAFLFVGIILLCPYNMGAWTTFVLVVVTIRYVMLVHKSISNTSILRREDRVLDFKRCQLGKIVNWAKGVRKELLMGENLLKLEFKTRLESCAVENEWVIKIAEIFGEEFQRIVEKAAKDLWVYINALKKPVIDYEGYEREVPRSFSKVLESALKVEADLVKTSLA